VKPWGAAWTISVMKDITWKRVPEAIMAKPDKFDAIWDAYQKELIDAGVEKWSKATKHMSKPESKLWNE
jgi:putative aldouronate transport system substrate-binding protein